jgi:eukaryotic-like serine/threonine-protein kinase
MSYCHECGAEVAKTDVFCSICGIAMEFPSAEEELPENVEKTVDAEVAQSIDDSVDSEKIESETEPSAQPFVQETDGVSADLIEQETSTDETFITEEVPIPSIILDNYRGKQVFETPLSSVDIEPVNIEPVNIEPVNIPAFPEFPESPAIEEIEIEKNLESESNDSEQVSEVEKNLQTSEKTVPVEEVDVFENINMPEILVADIKSEVDEIVEERIIENKSEISEAIEKEEVVEAEIGKFEATIEYNAVDIEDLNLKSESEEVQDSEIVETDEIAEEKIEELPVEEKVVIENDLDSAEEQSNVEEIADEEIAKEEIAEEEIAKEEIAKEEIAEEVIAAAVILPIIQADSQKIVSSQTTPVGENVDTGSKSKQLKPLEEGTLLNGRYEVVRKIGGGGMGAVYLASDRNLGGVLRAVKEMVQSYIEEEQQEKAVNDFRRESLLLTSLEHPSIPTIYDYFFDDNEGRFYLVMKYVSGGDLAGRLRSSPSGRIEEKSVVEWAIQVTDVLDYLHNRVPSIVYRDLKPSNIMIDGNSGRVMLIDFGIARWVNIEEKGVTAVGTMGYAPPELFSGNVEPRSDIYSLGSTMFHLLTGADPQNSPLLIFDFTKNPRPRQINSGLSDQIEQILMRSVEYDTGKRFSSAAEMRESMVRHFENLRTGKVTYGLTDGVSGNVSQTNHAVFCGFCGQKIVLSDMFCPFCGAKQPLEQQGSSQLSNSGFASANINARLVLIGTNDLDTPSYGLDKDSNLIGRRDPMSNIFPEVDLTKYDPQTKISRRHARLWREGDMFMVEDLGSSNGTTLNTSFNEQFRLLPHQPRVIAHGDKIKVGDNVLHFLVG